MLVGGRAVHAGDGVERIRGTHAGFRFQVLATDISTKVLAHAERGIYSMDDVEPVSPALRKKYLMRSRERDADRVRIVPELRRLVEFGG